MSQVNQDSQFRDEQLSVYRLCISLARQVKKQLGLNPRVCPLCGNEHQHPKAIQEVANRAFIGQ